MAKPQKVITFEEQKLSENHVLSQFVPKKNKLQEEFSPSKLHYHQQRKSTVDSEKHLKVNEVISKALSEGLMKESSGRLKALRPDHDMITNRIHSGNLSDLITPLTPMSPGRIRTTIPTPGPLRTNQIPAETNEHVKLLSKKKKAFEKEAPGATLTALAQQLFGNEKDSSLTSPKAIPMNALTSRVAKVEEEEVVDLSAEVKKAEIKRRARSPTFTDIESFYPKAKAKSKSSKKANTDDSKLDREAVENLDRWDNENKHASYSNGELKGILGERKRSQAARFTEPNVNINMINMIARPQIENTEKKRDNNAIFLVQSTGNTKSTEAIRQEANKKILNLIVYNKATKKLSDQIDNNSLSEQTPTIGGDIISNFKNLQKSLGSRQAGSMVEYDSLFEKLASLKFPPVFLFEFSAEKKQENNYEVIKKFMMQEKELLDAFQEAIIETHQKKEAQAKIRTRIHEMRLKIKNLKNENEELEEDFMRFEEKVKKGRQIIGGTLTKLTRHKRREFPNTNSLNIEDFQKLEKKRDEINSRRKENMQETNQLEQEFNRNTKTLGEIDNEITRLKLGKAELRIALKQLYLSLLKNERQLLLTYQEIENSLIHVVKQLWKINEEVIEDLFPSFLKRNYLEYLFKYAQLEYEFEQIEHYKQSDEYKTFMQIQGGAVGNKKTSSLSNVPLKVALERVAERIHKLKKGLTKRKKPVFASPGGSNIVKWEEMSDHNLSNQEIAQNDLIKFNHHVDMVLEEIKNEIIKLKEEETQRIYERYITKDIDENFLRYLSKLLICLFGQSEAERVYMGFVRLKQQYEIKTSQNKTFKLESGQASFLSQKIKSQSSLGLMMSHSSTFRKTGAERFNSGPKISETQGVKETNPEKKEKAISTHWINPSDQEGNVRLNYRYNVLYNYFPSMQNTSEQSTYTLSKKKNTAVKSNLILSKPSQMPGSLNSPENDSRPVTSRAISSRGFALTQQTGTVSTRTLSSYGRRSSMPSMPDQPLTTSSPLSTARDQFFASNSKFTDQNPENQVKALKKVVINSDRW